MEPHGDILKEIKLLYIEDDQDTVEELGHFLKRRAGKVYTACDGEEGLHLFIEHRPDILIVDLFLPKMSGIEMIKEIRRLGHETPVIITTAVDDSGVILSAMDIGIQKYILKPINTADLLNELYLLAEKISKRAENYDQFSFPNKQDLEDRIKREFSSALKHLAGKGPKDVTVFISKGNIEIYCSGVMTVYERSLLDNYRNIAIIEQNRRLFYKLIEGKISDLIKDILQRSVHLTQVEINLRNDCNKLIFRIDI